MATVDDKPPLSPDGTPALDDDGAAESSADAEAHAQLVRGTAALDLGADKGGGGRGRRRTRAAADEGGGAAPPPEAGGRQLYAFGWNGAGQLGTGDTMNQKIACAVGPLADKRVAIVACGGPYTVLATDTEEVWGFGANARGQLGLGHVMDQLQPCRLDPPKPLLSWKVELIACGYAHTVFLTDDLSVFSCGANSWGQLGLGDTDDRNHPCKVERLSKVAVRQLDCGAAHTMVVCDGARSDGSLAPPPIDEVDAPSEGDEGPDEEPDEPGPLGPGVYGFGRNKEGQLGLGPRSTTPALNDQIQRKPVLVETLAGHMAEEESALELRCGGYHTAVVVGRRKRLLTFGQNCYGQLGLGDQEDRFEPDEVDL